MTKLRGLRHAATVFLLSVATTIAARAQVFNRVDFDGANGAWPTLMSMVQGIDGSFYGTTRIGGAYASGNVFRITLGGKLTTSASFCSSAPKEPPNCADGAYPQAPLLLATDGDFYGTTSGSEYGASQGTVFRIDRHGTLTTMHAFTGVDGSDPEAGVVEGTDGNFYGTTAGGNGTVFKMTPDGTLTTLVSFDGANADVPEAGLVEGTDGNFYGTTFYGGSGSCGQAADSCGTVFKVTPSGILTILHTFTGPDGAFPSAPLVQASDGSFYGTTSGGNPGEGYQGPGTVFRITPTGELTTLHQFCTQQNCSDGANPEAELVLSPDGNFYGTNRAGGNEVACYGGCGTAFKMTPGGTLTTLHSFDGTDGATPYGGLLQSTDGVFYGTTIYGGNLACYPTVGCGTVFSLNMGLGPFVTFVQAAARAGRTGANPWPRIQGNNTGHL